MKMFLKGLLFSTAMAFGGAATAAEQPQPPACRAQTFAAVNYIICAADPGKAHLRLFWKDAEGKPYRTFAHVAEALAAEGKSLTFAMNAGMYKDDFSPLGLFVADGETLAPANTFEIKGSPGSVPNFYKKPKGVFFLEDRHAGILPMDTYLKRRGKATFATQSGPMLVIDGKTNPIFIPGSTDRTRRSGVGICESGVVRFAISDGPVNFHDFARLFRDELKCSNALFLDGGRGAGTYVPALDREDWSGHGGYGPIVGLVE
ncbi:phosphodiester glycosidase family protein [Rhizobium sp. TH2]|uniref:phosphodiester glycosidase family protein n=1 Tax=Rhizobium sp. TH2 TaxID=2775403 RepID=UPI002157FCE5|nr:phosphodiester glycosidase family protein [Rhizobium sp. TH2]